MRRKKFWCGWVLVLLVACPVSGVLAQSVSDDIEQLVLDVQKLSQLKQILAELYQEYATLHKGYEEIKQLSQGTFDLHKAFLDGLLLVSPAVSGYGKVGEIIGKEAVLIRDYEAASGYFRSTGLFTPAEMEGFLAIYGIFLQGGEKDVSELTMVTTDGTLRMSDGERLSAIDRIYADVTRQLSLLHGFDNSVAIQAAQRQQTLSEVGAVRGLYGIGP